MAVVQENAEIMPAPRQMSLSSEKLNENYLKAYGYKPENENQHTLSNSDKHLNMLPQSESKSGSKLVGPILNQVHSGEKIKSPRHLSIYEKTDENHNSLARFSPQREDITDMSTNRMVSERPESMLH